MPTKLTPSDRLWLAILDQRPPASEAELREGGFPEHLIEVWAARQKPDFDGGCLHCGLVPPMSGQVLCSLCFSGESQLDPRKLAISLLDLSDED